MRCIALIIGALALASGGVSAAPEMAAFAALRIFLPAQPGNKACYVRSYDAAHLRAHPHQRITAMTFLLEVQAYPDVKNAEQPQDRFYYAFAMSVARRGEKGLLRTAGDCMTVDGISCVVDCDGGGLSLDQAPPADSLIVRLHDDGIVMYHDCDGEDIEAVLVKPGSDDKVFRLENTSDNACRALHDNYFEE